MYERGLTVSVYESSCGLAFTFGWNPGYVTLMIGPLHIEWIF
jgi:hypothetical protein